MSKNPLRHFKMVGDPLKRRFEFRREGDSMDMQPMIVVALLVNSDLVRYAEVLDPEEACSLQGFTEEYLRFQKWLSNEDPDDWSAPVIQISVYNSLFLTEAIKVRQELLSIFKKAQPDCRLILPF